MSDSLSAIDAILNERLGLDRASIGPGLVPRAVRTRMRATGLVEERDYAELLTRSEAERQALIDEVVVPESWFFRDLLPFDFLRDHAREGWTARPARGPLRVLSLPCAGGEEPYSIAVTLEEAGLSPGRFRIDAVDVSERRLEFAKAGVYSRNALRGMGPERAARWFRERPDGFEVAESIRGRVRFRLGNILDPGLLADEPPYDVVFCRNLLIYLARAPRAQAEEKLDRLLAPDGILVIGHADALGASPAGRRFVPAAGLGTFALRRRRPDEGPSRPQSQPRPATASLPAPPRTPERPRLPAPAPAPISRPPTPTPIPAPPVAEDPRPWIERAMEHANQGRNGQALASCEAEIRRAGPSAEAYLLMAGIHQAAGRRSEAEGCYHKVIYLDPARDEALLALALIAEGRGDLGAAAGFRRRAERALKNRRADADINKTGGPAHE
ncbi:CheR family methyltransferase [Planctomyces sp. SH-PL62]|uniref:CheR family methyltransferase n=1 Tax=Planctomyces sp. SH-PL62 TaxID=1636152 RepID=UPI00078D404D|nr:protein-glutamate O-methyltransferase CheR [Planctomyces sp. SH-PL62]AMV37847.1 putative biofilm formation methyltransferase WspC [Planctomyces sp. SH-PL62]